MSNTLLAYQEDGARFLAARRFALLADEMRLGKSPQSVTACDMIGAKKIIVLCPAVARFNWEREFHNFSMLDRGIYVVLSKKDKIGNQDPDAFSVTIVSYNLLEHESIKTGLKTIKADVLILDESHFLKNSKAKRTKAVYGRHGLTRTVNRVWCLTATPTPNGYPTELWPMLRIFGLYDKKYDSFVKDFCAGYYDSYGFKITGSKHENKFKQLLSPIFLQRTLKQIKKDVPGLAITNYVVEKGEVDVAKHFPEFSNQQSFFEKLKEEFNIADTLLVKAVNAYPADLQDAAFPTLRKWGGLCKVDPVIELVNQFMLGNDRKLVLFAVHTGVILELASALEKFKPRVLYGKMSPIKKQASQNYFRKYADNRLFIGNIIAAGTNIDLSKADDIWMVEQSWVPGDNAQAYMRCSSVFKTRQVCVRIISIHNDIDEKINETLIRKIESLNNLFQEKT